MQKQAGSIIDEGKESLAPETLGDCSALSSKGNFSCLFVCNRVKTGSEKGSYANILCQITAVTAESFAAPVLDVFLTPLHGSC